MGYNRIKLKQNTFTPGPYHFKPGPVPLKGPQSPQVQHYRNIGNQSVQRMNRSGAIQAKLKIGQPNDKYEQEADRAADQVMRMPEPKQSLVNSHSSLVQRKAACSSCGDLDEEEQIQTKTIGDQITPLIQPQMDSELEEEEEEPVQGKPVDNKSTLAAADAGLQNQIQSMKGGGQPLPETTRSFFEPRFGTDFSQVRVHTGSQAAETSKSINAKAFTTGRDVVFGAGQYSPETSNGKRLLAHELTHFVQQNRGIPGGPISSPMTLSRQGIFHLQRKPGEDAHESWEAVVNNVSVPKSARRKKAALEAIKRFLATKTGSHLINTLWKIFCQGRNQCRSSINVVPGDGACKCANVLCGLWERIMGIMGTGILFFFLN